MADNSVITSITDWLIDLSLADPDINVMFRKMCERMLAAGFPISRAMICMRPVASPRPSGKTVRRLPPKGTSVKTSIWM